MNVVSDGLHAARESHGIWDEAPSGWLATNLPAVVVAEKEEWVAWGSVRVSGEAKATRA